MKTRHMAIAVLALSLAGVSAHYRMPHASRFQQYYAALHEDQPELTALQRVLVSLALSASN
jgi:hypothetical protein